MGLAQQPRVLSTMHLAELFHQPQNTEVCKSDWVRAGKFMRGEWPRPLPPIHEIVYDGGHGLDWQYALSYQPYLVIDTEYVLETKHMWCLGIGGPGTMIWQWWPDKETAAGRREVIETLRFLIGEKPIVFQNAMADIPIIEHNLHIRYEDYKQVDDLLFLHSLLWCELPHTLEFMASVTGWYEKMKHLPMNDPRYNAGDVAETIACWEQCYGEMRRDPQTAWVYRECMVPLIPIILEAQRLGLCVDRQKVMQARSIYVARKAQAAEVAAGYAGFPINLGSSKQLREFLNFDLKRKKPLKSIDEDVVAELRGAILPFDPQEEVTIETCTRRILQGAHPILEARVLYARAVQYLSHYVEPMLASSDGRVYAQFHPWTQNTGRWSTVKPPLAQLPHSLRGALLPDEGWEWVEFDWSTIELRLIAALAHDTPLLEAFEKEYDVHTVHMCQIFGYPLPALLTKQGIRECTEWAGAIGFIEDDPRRVFAKTLVYRLCYGGLPEGAPSIPGAMALGLKAPQLVTASRRWIAAHLPIKKFWKTIEQHALSRRQLRTFLGRRWNFLGHDRKRILRQMYDFPMQGAVADIMNLTLIRIKKALGARVRLAYTMHDSIKLQVMKGACLEEDILTIQTIAQTEWNVSGIPMSFPAEFSRRSCK